MKPKNQTAHVRNRERVIAIWRICKKHACKSVSLWAQRGMWRNISNVTVVLLFIRDSWLQISRRPTKSQQVISELPFTSASRGVLTRNLSRGNGFDLQERLCNKTRFEAEEKSNSEFVYGLTIFPCLDGEGVAGKKASLFLTNLHIGRVLKLAVSSGFAHALDIPTCHW